MKKASEPPVEEPPAGKKPRSRGDEFVGRVLLFMMGGAVLATLIGVTVWVTVVLVPVWAWIAWKVDRRKYGKEKRRFGLF